MAGKKLHMGAILSDLADKMASMSANMIDVVNRLEAVSANTSQGVQKLNIKSSVAVDALQTALSPLSQKTAANQNCGGSGSAGNFYVMGTYLSMAAGTVAFKGLGNLVRLSNDDTYTYEAHFYVNVDGVNYVATQYVMVPSGGGFYYLPASEILNIPVAQGQTVTWGFWVRSTNASASLCTYLVPINVGKLTYELLDLVNESGFNVLT